MMNRESEISNLYRKILNREPDYSGLTHYVNSDKSIEQIKQIFYASDEYKSRNVYEPGVPLKLNLFDQNFDFYIHDPELDKVVSREIILNRGRELELSKIWYNHINSGDLVLDIGANIGWYTKLANLKDATVIAIEPDITNFKLLEQNSCCENELHNICAGNSTDDVMLKISNDNYGDHRTTKTGDIACKQNTIDQIVGDRANQIRAIKIDTQGWEPNIIAGAANTLKNVPDDCLLIVEYWPWGLNQNGFNQHDYSELYKHFKSKPIFYPKELDWDNSKNDQTQHIDIILSKTENLSFYENKKYSQNGEDGIIEHIFDVIGTTNNIAVEIGVSVSPAGLIENNTMALAEKGWKLLWFDIEDPVVVPENCTFIKDFVTKDNICKHLEDNNVPREFDLLSIDIDSMDYYIREALREYKPRVYVAEYNGCFDSTEEYVLPYNESYQWTGESDRTFGVSLTSLYNQANNMGYDLVYCDKKGVNAFFIRKDINVFKPKLPSEAWVKLHWS